MTRAALLLVVALMIAPAAAQAAPPENDDFVAAQRINAVGTAMPRDRITLPTVDTTEATVQADLLSPAGPGGVAEPTDCTSKGRTTPFGKTVWYAFTPDVHGFVAIQSAGYNATLALIRLEGTSPQDYTCINNLDGLQERMRAEVDAKVAYAIQVGGAADDAGAPVSGLLDVSVAFTPDRDGDGVIDDRDGCPTRAGPVDGCLRRIAMAWSEAHDNAGTGIRLTRLLIEKVPRGTLLKLRCSRICGSRRIRTESSKVAIRSLRSRVLTPGTTIEIRASKPGYFGDYLKLRVGSGLTGASGRCLVPGSDRPRRTCR